MSAEPWSPLPSNEWHPTLETVHLWTQVVGKVRLVQSPWLNHSWSVTLYVRPTGLTTGHVPHGREALEICEEHDPLVSGCLCQGTRRPDRVLPKQLQCVEIQPGERRGLLPNLLGKAGAELPEKRHRILDRRIEEETAHPSSPDHEIMRLKLEKLRIKEEIEKLQAQTGDRRH